MTFLHHGSLALAEGLDVPNARLVSVEPGNPLLQHLVHIPELEECWEHLVSWMESEGEAGERLEELRQAYYRLFLAPGTDFSLYLHDWYRDTPPHKLLAEWQLFLRRSGVKQSGEWRNGVDHISVAMELLAHLTHGERSVLEEAVGRYLLPGFPVFVQKFRERADHPFYQALGGLAQEVHNEIQLLAG